MKSKSKNRRPKPGAPTLRDVGEDRLVELLTRGLADGGDGVLVGPGDDCAVLDTPPTACSSKPRRRRESVLGTRRAESSGTSSGNKHGKCGADGRSSELVLLFKTDCVVEGVHFAAGTAPSKIGRKALARVLSDLAAMGGRPRTALVTLVLPPELRVAYVRALFGGIRRLAERTGVVVVGGETSSCPTGAPLVCSIAMLGEVDADACVLRSTGRVGDILFVTGRLGGSIRGKHLSFEPRLEEARWLARQFPPTAMMDLSDGLARDLPRLAVASGVGFELETCSLPRNRGCDISSALGDGEDYELLFAMEPETADSLPGRWSRRFPSLALTRIGRFCRKPPRGKPGGDNGIPGAVDGWEHFTVSPHA